MNPSLLLRHREEISASWIKAYLICQPVLDVLSYWLGDCPHGNAVSLIIRIVLLIGTVLASYALSDEKKEYYYLLAALAFYWVLHVISCVRVGYQAPLDDFINYSRVAQIPILTLCFLTLLKNVHDWRKVVESALTAALYLFAGITLVSVVTGTSIYTYYHWKVGVTGWFSLPNSQSAILGALSAISILTAIGRGDWIRASIRAAIGFALLFFLGTRIAYFEIIMIAAACIVFMAVTHHFQWRAAAAVAAAAAICALCYPLSPMAENRRLFAESVVQQQKAADGDAAAESVSTDALYEKYVPAIVDRFGLEAAEDAYGYSRDISVIGDVRHYKLNYCRMVMEELPVTSKLFGFELAMTRHQNAVLDVENDFHGVYFLYGIAGLLLLTGFLLVFALKALHGLFQKRNREAAMWMPAFSFAAALMVVNAYFSASVLRRPNASVYLSLILAVLWRLNEDPGKRMS